MWPVVKLCLRGYEAENDMLQQEHKNTFAAEDELQCGMNGGVRMLKLLNRKRRVSILGGGVGMGGRASGIERRKASLFESLRRVLSPTRSKVGQY